MSWFTIYSEKKVYPLNLQPEDIDIETIAHSLALQCRWLGHVREFYSVAEHCCRVAEQVFIRYGELLDEPVMVARQRKLGRAGLLALLHDADETYTGDIISPWKGHVLVSVKQETAIEGHRPPEQTIVQGTVPFREVQAAVLGVVASGLNIPELASVSAGKDGGEIPTLIRHFDRQLLVTEARDLFKNHPHWEDVPHWPDPLPETIKPWTWKRAEGEFLDLYRKFRALYEVAG